MTVTLLKTVFLTGFQIVIVLLLSPLINTFIKKLKALFQGRQGPPIMQGYYDLLKYFHKETVVSNKVSRIFIFSPYLIFSATLFAALLVPTFVTIPKLYILGGIILLIYLFGLCRFFMATSAMEPGSGFCGMASSREMMLGMLTEPVVLLSLFVLAIMAGSMNIPEIIIKFSTDKAALFSPAFTLAILALLVASVAEMGRIPFDNPETHYELTMIHEGMLLEYSGKLLALMFWSSWMKQLLILSMLANLMFPLGYSVDLNLSNCFFQIIIYLIKLLSVCFIIAVIETMLAKVRLFRVKEILVTSFVMSIIALVFSVQSSTRGLTP